MLARCTSTCNVLPGQCRFFCNMLVNFKVHVHHQFLLQCSQRARAGATQTSPFNFDDLGSPSDQTFAIKTSSPQAKTTALSASKTTKEDPGTSPPTLTRRIEAQLSSPIPIHSTAKTQPVVSPVGLDTQSNSRMTPIPGPETPFRNIFRFLHHRHGQLK